MIVSGRASGRFFAMESFAALTAFPYARATGAVTRSSGVKNC